ncbi:MAG: hypothetical protein RLZZ613_1425, partial [Pseudomonadota bacterium]
IIIAGGMESMSNVPFYNMHQRWGNKYGDTTLLDGLAKDGLAKHDSYGFFKDLNTLVHTGPTLTNVNDFRILLIDSES